MFMLRDSSDNCLRERSIYGTQLEARTKRGCVMFTRRMNLNH